MWTIIAQNCHFCKHSLPGRLYNVGLLAAPWFEGQLAQCLADILGGRAADPAVLLLDEITANLDAETESRVLEALRQASLGRTVLSVSHRMYESLGGRIVEIAAPPQ